MPLNETAPPDAVHKVFQEGIGQTSDTARGPRWCAPIYALTVDDLANTGGDPSPKPVGWYCAAPGEQGLMAGEVPNVPDGSDGNQQLTTSLTIGSYVQDTWKSYLRMKQHPELEAQPFDLRWLRIAGLGIDAFWVKSLSHGEFLGGGDWVYAFLAFQPELKDKLLTAAAFLKIVRKLAAASLVIDTTPALPR